MPENTSVAFAGAWEAGADGMECDLRLTRDGEVVAIHDASGKRTLGDRRKIRSLTLSELHTLDAGRWKGVEFQGTKVPTLREVIEQMPVGKECVLELKEGSDLVSGVVSVLDGTDCSNFKLVLISFDFEVIKEAGRRIPGARALWLFNDYHRMPWERRGQRGQWLARQVRDAGLHGVDLGFGAAMTCELVASLKQAGCEVYTYTINTPAALSACIAAGVDAVTTDYPECWISRKWNFLPKSCISA